MTLNLLLITCKYAYYALLWADYDYQFLIQAPFGSKKNLLSYAERLKEYIHHLIENVERYDSDNIKFLATEPVSAAVPFSFNINGRRQMKVVPHTMAILYVCTVF